MPNTNQDATPLEQEPAKQIRAQAIKSRYLAEEDDDVAHRAGSCCALMHVYNYVNICMASILC